MKLTVTEIVLHKEEESPIFGEIVTNVKLDDDGAGLFIKITQYSGNDVGTICIDFNEVEHIVKAIDMLKESAGDQIK